MIFSLKQVGSKTFEILFDKNTTPRHIKKYGRWSIKPLIMSKTFSRARRSIRTSKESSWLLRLSTDECRCRSARLDIVDTALSLVTDLTGHIIELETRLASHLPLMNEESHLHRQLDDLQQLDKHLQSIEKSIKELLGQSHQLGNERLTRISDQLAARWKQIHGEINQRFVLALFATSSHLRPV